MRRSPWCVSDMKNPRACEGSRVGALLPARGALRDARRAGTFSDAAAEAGAIEPPAHTTAPRTGPEGRPRRCAPDPVNLLISPRLARRSSDPVRHTPPAG